MKNLLVIFFFIQWISASGQNIHFTSESKLFDLPGQNRRLENPFKTFLVGEDPNHWFFGFNGGKCLGFRKDTVTGQYVSITHNPISPNKVVLDVRDYNNDGNYEILTDAELYYFRTTGNFWTFVFIDIMHNVYKGFGDFNNDGRMDIIAEGDEPFAGDPLYLILNEGENKFNTIEIAGKTNELETMATGDINNDGFLDFAFTQSTGRAIKLFFNNGDSTFTTKEIISSDNSCCNSLSIELVDMDNDGDLDILSPGRNAGIFIINNEDGFQTMATVTQPQIKNVSNVTSAKAHDFNKDGAMDIVFVEETPGFVRLYLLEGKGDGTFYQPVLLQTFIQNSQTGYFDGTAHRENLQMADINKDGFTDIAFTSSENKKQIVLYFDISSSTSESEISSAKYFYPTVTNGQIFTRAPEGSVSRVTDLFGREVFVFSNDTESISLEHLDSGTYLIMTYQNGILKGRDRVMVMK